MKQYIIRNLGAECGPPSIVFLDLNAKDCPSQK